jgi:hypothetical protein
MAVVILVEELNCLLEVPAQSGWKESISAVILAEKPGLSPVTGRASQRATPGTDPASVGEWS